MFSDLFPELVGFVPGVGFVKFLTEGEDVVLLGGGSGGAGIGGLFLWLLIKFVRVLLVTVVTKGGLAIERSEAWCLMVWLAEQMACECWAFSPVPLTVRGITRRVITWRGMIWNIFKVEAMTARC